MSHRPPRFTLFPYTTLFRSRSLRGSGRKKNVRPEGLELSASLLDGNAVIQAANGVKPENGAAADIEFSALNEGHGRERNSNIRRLARRQAREPLASDADNRERMALDANLLADNIERAAETAPPEFIADNGDLRGYPATGI